MLELEVRAGKATPKQVEEARAALDALKGYVPPKASLVTKQVATAPKLLKELDSKELSGEVQAIVKQLKEDQEKVDFEKRQLSMSLQGVSKTEICKDITDKILSLREKWREIGDTIYFVIEHGHLPGAPVEESIEDFGKNLPNDKFTLDKMIENLNINVNYRWPKRMATAKNEAKKSEFAIRIAKGERMLEVMRSKFKSLK